MGLEYEVSHITDITFSIKPGLNGFFWAFDALVFVDVSLFHDIVRLDDGTYRRV